MGFRIRGNANFRIRVGGNANSSIFRYQHVGISKAKFRVGGLSQRKDPTQRPNANVFVLQLNIGFRSSLKGPYPQADLFRIDARIPKSGDSITNSPIVWRQRVLNMFNSKKPECCHSMGIS